MHPFIHVFDFIATLLKFEKSECAFEQWANISHTPQKHSTLQNSTAACCPMSCGQRRQSWSNYPRRPTAAGALLLVSGMIVGDEEEDDDNDGEFVADDD